MTLHSPAGTRARFASQRIQVQLVLVFGFLFVLAVLRIPEALLRAEFWADDGRLYTDALLHGPASILMPYAGYLLVGTRAVAWLETLVPPRYAPLLGNLVALTVLAAVAAFASSSRMRWDRPTGTMIGVGIVLLPASFQVMGTLSHMQWPAMLWIALVALSREPASQRGRAAEALGLIAAGLTGPGAVLFLPLFLRSRLRQIIVGAVAAVQTAVILTATSRLPAAGADLAVLPQVLVLHIFTVPLAGPRLSLPGIVGVGVAAAVAILLTRSTIRWQLAYLLLVPAIAGIIVSEFATASFLDPWAAPRYFWIPGAALVMLLATQRSRVVAWPLIALFLIGATADFRIAVPSAGWAENSACIGGATPCVVPVVPGAQWAVQWPGR